MSETDDRKAPGAVNMLVFLLLFLVPASFTYLSGLFVIGGALSDDPVWEDADALSTGRMFLLGLCYAFMLLACSIRGRAVGREWIIAFPIVGAIFDIWLAFIPFVPTVMNIVVLATGIPQPSKTK